MTRDFHGYVQRKLGIEAHPLTSHEETMSGQVHQNENRLKACTGQLMKTLRIPGFEYSSGWLVREMSARGFTRGETESSIDHLVRHGVLMRTEKGVKMS
jgi:hypothetical protein